MKKLIVLLLLLVAACNSEINQPLSIEGNYYSNEMIIQFDNGNVSGHLVCNEFHGTYTVSGNEISMQIISTKIGCNELNINYLKGVSKFYLSDEMLVLEGSDYSLNLYKSN